MNSKIKIGVLGAGHLGKIHLRLLKESARYDLVGFYDTQPQQAARIAREFGYRSFNDINSLLESVDVVDIVTPTVTHYELAKSALERGKHVFLEKPITTTVEEAKDLVELAKKKNLQGMVGQVERFNPAFMAARPHIKHPMFIESHRLAEFNPRGTDVSVVLDLMIHDIDAVLSVVSSKVVDVQASGVSVISDTPDIANARLRFENGCVANLTASRISMKTLRKSRFFQRDAYVSVDFFEKKVEVVRMQNAPESPEDFAMVLENAEGIKKQIFFDNPNVSEGNAIQLELENFADAIQNNKKPAVTLQAGTSALEVAYQILNCF
ncbi:MAG: Gfo/Idh/MocA family oxidoreductase [Flavobacteriaceae bacterium]|nr:Gfo/Idh/MocA family oxidoreductase [Flavobacteriaceae bacterium]MBT7459289.1 Gfo/Idh/MocA family oxidoreductase [Flavobacteriaceae bacterium]